MTAIATDIPGSRALHAEVWRLAWPAVLTMLLQTLNSFLDRFFVGGLGPAALAAVGVAGQVLWAVMAVAFSVSIGTTALVARFTGAGDREQARIAANQSLRIVVVASLVCVVAMWPLRGAIVRALGVGHEAAGLAESYLGITVLGLPSLYLMLVLGAAYRGIGDTMTPFLVMIVVNAVHLLGDYALIFGAWGAPRLGLPGGAVALAVSQVIGAVLFLALLRRTPLRGMLRASRQWEWGWARRILRIGVPAACHNGSRVLSMLVYTGILAHGPDRTAGLAALTIGMTSESLAFMPGIGFSTAASTLTGQSLGAHAPDRADRAARAALLQGIVVMTLLGAVFYLCAEQFTAIFTRDPETTRLAVAYLRIMALSEPLLACAMILTGALQGAGDTVKPAWAGVASMWGVRLPLAWWWCGAAGYGAVGAWWAMALSTMVAGLLALLIFRRGGWKRQKV